MNAIQRQTASEPGNHSVDSHGGDEKEKIKHKRSEVQGRGSGGGGGGGVSHRSGWRSWLPLLFFLIFFTGGFVYSRYHSQGATSSTNMKRRQSGSNPSCPDYFRWIHEDLNPWRATGISREMVKNGQDKADFRLVIVNGTAYGEIYTKSRSDRAVFTLWGIVQLLRRYPGKLSDLDLMFRTEARPIIKRELYVGSGKEAPPPLFGYAGDDATFDIAFPDWSFWGWPNRKLKAWEGVLKEMKEGNRRRKWGDRDPHAYWRGALSSAERMDLAQCNVSDKQDWDARIFDVDWNKEKEQDLKYSSIVSPCTHRFQMYMEGGAGWSASEKYILACDSPTLRMKPLFYSFFSRTLMPLQHYWPINPDHKCRSIMYAVQWGNVRRDEAESIGKAASSFIENELKMEAVYDYMFHVLNEYGKLFKFKPRVPPKAIRLGSGHPDSMGLGPEKMKYMMESSVRGPSSTKPCRLPPPYRTKSLAYILERKKNITEVVKFWERNFWNA